MLSLARFVILFGLPLYVAAEEYPRIDRIEMKSTWAGILESRETVLTLERSGDHFVARGKEMDARKIAALVAALGSPPVAEADAFGSLINQHWLVRHASYQAREQYGYDQKQKASFEALFRDLDFMSRTFRLFFSEVIMDDSPRVDVVILFVNGDRWAAESYATHPWMLPWRVQRNENAMESFNGAIAVAIGRLLPSGSTNRERLLGSDVPYQLSRQIRHHMLTQVLEKNSAR